MVESAFCNLIIILYTKTIIIFVYIKFCIIIEILFCIMRYKILYYIKCQMPITNKFNLIFNLHIFGFLYLEILLIN